jgi:hypothetical protein
LLLLSPLAILNSRVQVVPFLLKCSLIIIAI